MNNNFKNVRYDGDGGAIYFIQSGTVKNCNFTNNSAIYGGAIDFEGVGNVAKCNFANNSAFNRGGAIYFFVSGTVENCNLNDPSAAVCEKCGSDLSDSPDWGYDYYDD